MRIGLAAIVLCGRTAFDPVENVATDGSSDRAGGTSHDIHVATRSCL